jgi:hypothetical protein
LTASASLRLDARVKIAKPVVATERSKINIMADAMVRVTDFFTLLNNSELR